MPSPVRTCSGAQSAPARPIRTRSRAVMDVSTVMDGAMQRARYAAREDAQAFQAAAPPRRRARIAQRDRPCPHIGHGLAPGVSEARAMSRGELPAGRRSDPHSPRRDGGAQEGPLRLRATGAERRMLHEGSPPVAPRSRYQGCLARARAMAMLDPRATRRCLSRSASMILALLRAPGPPPAGVRRPRASAGAEGPRRGRRGPPDAREAQGLCRCE